MFAPLFADLDYSLEQLLLLFIYYFYYYYYQGVQFNKAGDVLFSVSSDKSLQGINCDGKQVVVYSHAHSCPINKFIVVNDNMIGN